MLLEFGAKTDFIPLADWQTRINVKINAGQETEINGQGPKITETAIQELFEKLKSLKAGDVLVLAGSIPSTLPENIYEWILMCLKDKDVKVVVDATKDLLLNVLKYHPFLIKPNNHELGEMFQTTLTTEEEIIAHAKKLQERGARNVLVSMAKDGAILVTEDGEIYKKQPHNGTVVNSAVLEILWLQDFWRDISILALMSVHWSLELQREVRRHFSPGWHPGRIL